MSTPQHLETLNVTERDTTLNPRQLRKAGFVPATIYGKGLTSQSIQFKTHEFTLALSRKQREFRLQGLAGEVTVRVQQMQLDPVSQLPLSVEFCHADSPNKRADKKAAADAQKKTAPEAGSRADNLEAALETAEPEAALSAI